jgi:signal transduction histidine kinase
MTIPISTDARRLVSWLPGMPAAMRPLNLFVVLVVIAGVLALAHSLARLPYTPQPLQWMTLGVFATIAGVLAVRVPGVPVQVSVSDTFFFTSALLFGPAPATVTIAIDSFLISWRSGHRVERVMFNTANPALALWVGSQAFFAMARTPSLSHQSTISSETIVLPLVVMTALYFLINSGFTAIAVALERAQPAFQLWRRHFAGISLHHFAAASASFFVVVTVRSVSAFALALILPLLVIFYVAMRSWLGRVGDAQRHIVEVDRLYLSNKRCEGALLEISAREQRRIGMDLHDNLGQHLAGTAFISKALQQRLEAQGLPEAVEAGKIVMLMNTAIEKTRELSRGLVPVVSGADGLMASLQRLAGEVQDFFSVSCRFVCDVPVLLDDVVAGTHLFHIAQEAVSNAIKHGRATRIVVALSALGDSGRLAIEDNGVGIPSMLNRTSGMGLYIMGYRATIIGGSLEVTREPNGAGTIVKCSFPMRMHV